MGSLRFQYFSLPFYGAIIVTNHKRTRETINSQATPSTPQAQDVLITYNFRLMNELINFYYVIHYGPLTQSYAVPVVNSQSN